MVCIKHLYDKYISKYKIMLAPVLKYFVKKLYSKNYSNIGIELTGFNNANT